MKLFASKSNYDFNSAANLLGAIHQHYLLFGNKQFEALAGMDVIPLCIEGATINWVTSELPAEIRQSIPLESHRVVGYSEEKFLWLHNALEHIQLHHPEQWLLVKEFLKNIVWMEIKEAYRGKDAQITSSSFPVLPYFAFISNKATHHIPPNTISERPSHRFLAENLVHEAIHQQVNLTILEKELFSDNFDARSAPKIEIPWRSKHGARNQRWELDRVLHASAVYIQLVDFRLGELNSDKLAFEAPFFREALQEAASVLDYLTSELNRYHYFFSEDGRQLIRGLRAQASQQIHRITPDEG